MYKVRSCLDEGTERKFRLPLSSAMRILMLTPGVLCCPAAQRRARGAGLLRADISAWFPMSSLGFHQSGTLKSLLAPPKSPPGAIRHAGGQEGLPGTFVVVLGR